jgi:exosortase/archaeosortase
LTLSPIPVLEILPVTLQPDLTIWEGVMDTIRIWDLLLLLPSLIILGLSYKNWWKFSSLLRGTGSFLFGLYWLVQVFVFLDPSHPDIVNGVISLLGFLFFSYIAWHCYLDHKWEEETKSIGWLMRTAFITGSAYFILEHIPVTQGFLIYIVAWLTYGVLILFGHDVTIQAGFPIGINEGLPIPSGDPNDTQIRIVFACTAALALFLFTAAIMATHTDKNEWKGWARKELKKTKDSTSLWTRSRRNGIKNILRMSDKERKIRAFLYVIPIIFVTNIFRNVGVISVTYLFDLTKRVKKGMIVEGRLDLKYIEKKK